MRMLLLGCALCTSAPLYANSLQITEVTACLNGARIVASPNGEEAVGLPVVSQVFNELKTSFHRGSRHTYGSVGEDHQFLVYLPTHLYPVGATVHLSVSETENVCEGIGKQAACEVATVQNCMLLFNDCPPSPIDECNGFSFDKAKLKVREGSTPEKHRVSFAGKGGMTPPGFFGNPTMGDNSAKTQGTCVYDGTNGLVLQLRAEVNSEDLDGNPLWTHKDKTDKQFNRYKNKDGNIDDVVLIKQKTGEKTKVKVKAKGADTDVDVSLFSGDALTVQHYVTDRVVRQTTCSQVGFQPDKVKVNADRGKVAAKAKP